MAVSRRTLQLLIGEPDYSRGESYHRQERVVTCTFAGGDCVSGSVTGSGHQLYRQTVALKWNGARELVDVDGHCSCPVGHNCKHVAALMLEASRLLAAGADSKGAGAVPAPTRRLGYEIEHWLDLIRGADAPAVSDEDYPETVRDRIHYVLGLDLSRRLRVTPMKGSIRKDGTLGKCQAYRFNLMASGGVAKFIRPSDIRIAALLERFGLMNAWSPARELSPQPGDLAGLVEAIIETGRGHWLAVDAVALRHGAARTGSLVWRDHSDGVQKLQALDAEGRDIAALPIDPPFYVDAGTGACGPIDFGMPGRLVRAFLSAPEIPPEAAEQVAEVIGGLASAKPPAPAALQEEVREGGAPVPVLHLLCLKATRMEGWRFPYANLAIALPALRLAFDYGGRVVASAPRNDLKFREGEKAVLMRRNGEAEDAALDLLAEYAVVPLRASEHLRLDRAVREADLGFSQPEDLAGFAYFHGQDQVGSQDCLDFVSTVLPDLRQRGWRVTFEDSWPYRIHDGPVSIRSGLEESAPQKSDIDWFSFSLTVDAGGQSLDLLPVILSIVEILPAAFEEWEAPEEEGGDEAAEHLDDFLEDLVLYPVLPDGSYIRLDGPPLAPIVRALLGVYGLAGRFHAAEAGRVVELAEALEGCGVPFEGGAALRSLGEKLRRLAASGEAEPPAEFTGILRPYQKSGYGWLQALCQTGFGGVLADDMGLGKTVQALALLAARHLRDGADRPSLLVVPTSLIGNWRREAARFAPGLKLLILHGPDRKKMFAEIPDHHVVLTTYPLLHRDHEILLAHRFDVAILDEAQAVKNPAASISRRIRDIDARQRLAMSGTPIENNLEELWALFDWLIPGLLGNLKAFRTVFRTPIEKHGDKTAHALLTARIKPFLLRRTKEEVASDLPEKTEITELVPLAGGQRNLYETLRAAMDKRVRDAIRAKGLNSSRITILDALLKLRQACCDPGLVKLDAARKVKESAKRSRLMEMLEELLDEGRRVLVFSQFVEMLELIEADVTARGWDYTMLTGRSKNRSEIVERFQSGDAPIFLVSLKAGGVGLNLTAADTVILYDPWWNPAVERQAMDRAHRIGQDKAVFVYRLVAEGTVEAAIQELQAKKLALADALFEESGAGPLALTENDLSALFQPVQG